MQRNNLAHYLTSPLSKISLLFFMGFFLFSFIVLISSLMSPAATIISLALGNSGMLISIHLRSYLQENNLEARKVEAVASIIVMFYSAIMSYVALKFYGWNAATLLNPRLNPFVLVNLIPLIASIVNCIKFAYRDCAEDVDTRVERRLLSRTVTISQISELVDYSEHYAHPVSSQMSNTLRQQASEQNNYQEIRNNLNNASSETPEKDIESLKGVPTLHSNNE